MYLVDIFGEIDSPERAIFAVTGYMAAEFVMVAVVTEVDIVAEIVGTAVEVVGVAGIAVEADVAVVVEWDIDSVA